MKYYHKVGLALDQLLNAILGGMPDESVSARAYRWHRDGKRSWPYKLINKLFFWMEDHCWSAYHCEQELRHMPPEYRDREK
jgi:hypothetical protein